ncbi:hypothetical protein RSAG8_12507, partial [Rhizoctonia solani AG-8 WAC10335]
MAGHPGWYPISQVCYPPELPAYFKNISDLKPIVGVPKDTEVVAIHSVMHAANRVAGVPGMHDPKFFMKLAGHLFNVQMARYRSKYSLITFPSDATYVPPVLPAHITINLESVSGAPSDDDITKVQDAIQIHQELRRVPSMFDAHINMELSQHLFDLQMARHMCVAGEGQPIHEPQAVAIHDGPTHVVEETPDIPEEMIIATNNAGTGANATGVYQAPQLAPGIDIRELMKQSNQLAKQFNQLLERSNELAERSRQTMDQSSAHVLAERFNQVLDRITRLAETPHQPAERHDQLAERFNQLFERFNQLVEQSNQPPQRANELTERSNEFADKANQLAEQLNELFERSNQLSEQANESGERLGDILGNINKVLMRIQHANGKLYIFRLRKADQQSCVSGDRWRSSEHFCVQLMAG